MNHSSRKLSLISLLAMGVAVTPAIGQGAQSTQSRGTEKTLTGIISDAMCGATHMAKNKTAAECTRMCVQQGQKYALVVGTKVYTLNGHEQELDKLAGQKATVKGTVNGDAVSVSSVKPANKKSAS